MKEQALIKSKGYELFRNKSIVKQSISFSDDPAIDKYERYICKSS